MSIQCRTPNKVPSKSKLNKCSFDLSMKYLCCYFFCSTHRMVQRSYSGFYVCLLACSFVRSLGWLIMRVSACQEEVFPKPGFDLLFVDRFDSQTFMCVVRDFTSLHFTHSERDNLNQLFSHFDRRLFFPHRSPTSFTLYICSSVYFCLVVTQSACFRILPRLFTLFIWYASLLAFAQR